MTEQVQSRQSVLHRQCQDYLKSALDRLDVLTHEIYISNLATLVLQSMVGPHRFFHNFDHVVEVGGDTDPIDMLASVFHDIVYIQIDTGVPFNLTPFLSLVVQEINGVMMLRSQLPQTPKLDWLLDLFGFEPGQILRPAQGLNEFLSAVVAVRVLEPLLSLKDRLAIAICIEATIPFRMTEGTHGMPEVTLVRLRRICQQQGWSISEAELVDMVRRSVRIANRDVLSFAQPSAAHFLADVWNLLPESNHRLSTVGLYRVQDYRNAIAKTESFFRRIHPRSIFRQFRGEPSPEIYRQWQIQATQNLLVGRLYLSCKLVTSVLLEALTEPFGQQTSMELFMGSLPHPKGESVLRLEQFLPPAHWSGPPLCPTEQEVWQLLSEGRAASSHLVDLVDSPLATFVVQYHGFKGIPKQRRSAKAWLEGSLPSKEFLQQFDPQFLNLLHEAIGRLWESRQQLLQGHFSAHLNLQTPSPISKSTTFFGKESSQQAQSISGKPESLSKLRD